MAETSRVKLSLAEYRAELLALLPPTTGSLSVELCDALGRVLAEPVTATTANPAFTNSAMDGYAVRFADLHPGVSLRVVADLPAGSSADPALDPGECARIMTGAPLPASADTVIPVEHTDAGSQTVLIHTCPNGAGAHVRLAGEDYPAGAVVAEVGTLVTPGVVGSLAAAGRIGVAVRPRPVVAVCATGDELVHDGGPLARGQLHDSNSPTLAALLTADGAVVRRGTPLPDRADALRDWLDEVSGESDLVILTGGASVGTYDVVRDVLTEAGGVFRHVSVQPGKPQGWARWAGTPVVSLPGNPMSTALCYHVFVRPLLRHFLGLAAPATLTATTDSAWRSPQGRTQLMPVRLTCDGQGRLHLTPAHQRGSASHLVSSLAAADGIAVVPATVDEVAIDDLVEVWPL